MAKQMNIPMAAEESDENGEPESSMEKHKGSYQHGHEDAGPKGKAWHGHGKPSKMS